MQELKTTIVGFALYMCIIPACAEPIGDWQLTCIPQMCELTQTARNNADGEAAKITISPRQRGLFALVAVPLGISLSAGLSLKADQRAATVHAFATCTVGGCFSAVPLTGGTLASLEKGNQLTVSYQDGAGASQQAIVSLIGVTAGIEALRKSSATPDNGE